MNRIINRICLAIDLGRGDGCRRQTDRKSSMEAAKGGPGPPKLRILSGDMLINVLLGILQNLLLLLLLMELMRKIRRNHSWRSPTPFLAFLINLLNRRWQPPTPISITLSLNSL